MTKEKIQKRIEEIKTSMLNLQAQLQMHQGALEDCQYWLEELEKEEVTDEKDPFTITAVNVPGMAKSGR